MNKRGPKPKDPADLVQKKNISLDADLQDLLGEIQVQLEEEFGFKPTLSQTVRHIIKIFRKNC